MGIHEAHEVDVLVHVAQEESQESQVLLRLLPYFPIEHKMVQFTPFQYPTSQLRQLVLFIQLLQGLIQLSHVLLELKG
jgi:hypothetical protein